MSAENDTFDIDIYGENEQQQQQQDYEQEIEGLEDGGEYGYDGAYGDAADHQDKSAAQNPQDDATVPAKDEQTSDHHTNSSAAMPPTAPPQGTKRKAPDDDFEERDQPYPTTEAIPANDAQSIDPGATNAIKFADLNWWTTEEDLRAFCAQASVETELREITFGEHKINGKSRGEAYLEFSSPQAATAVKREVDKANQLASSAAPGKRAVLAVHYAPVGNPFKTGASAGGSKFNAQSNTAGGGGRGGAYNQSYGHQRGNFGGRGGFNANRGGFNNNNGNFNRMNQHQTGWIGNGGMNGNMGGFGGNNGFGGNPMMGMMGNFNNMGRGGMMNNMMNMGRGGFGMGSMGGGPMMGRGNMMGGGGMNMMGRGGWNGGGFQGGMQQGFPNGGFQGGGGMQQGNKRAKME